MFLSLLAITLAAKVQYDDYKVYKLNISNPIQLKMVEALQKNTAKYNIWKDYDEVSKEIHIMVNPKELALFKRMTHNYAIKTELLIDNVQE